MGDLCLYSPECVERLSGRVVLRTSPVRYSVNFVCAGFSDVAEKVAKIVLLEDALPSLER